jgi:hypothetical protein
MTHPLYVLLPADVEWIPVPGASAQAPKPVRWYLRQHMPDAAQSIAVLVAGADAEQARVIEAVAHQAEQLGGVVVDAATQELLDLDSVRAQLA